MDDRREDELRTRAFLVEHYWPGVTSAEFEAAVERVSTSADELAIEGKRVRYLHSTLIPEDEAAFCVLEAASQALVEEVYARAGVRFERVLDAVESHPLGGRHRAPPGAGAIHGAREEGT